MKESINESESGGGIENEENNRYGGGGMANRNNGEIMASAMKCGGVMKEENQ
jgi:hypothetical protein